MSYPLEGLLRERFGNEYANRLIKAYEGEDTITAIAKDFNKTRQAVSANIIRYLGYKKRYGVLMREDIIENFFKHKIDRLPQLAKPLELLKNILLDVDTMELKRLFGRTFIVVSTEEGTKRYGFKYRLNVKFRKFIPIWTPSKHFEGDYVIVVPDGLTIKYLKYGYTSIPLKEFTMSRIEILNKLIGND